MAARWMQPCSGCGPNIIILDLMLPGEDGLSICRRLRADDSIPILMLTAKSDEIDRVVGLEMGADDYLAKPFGPRELLARVRVILRRANGAPAKSVVRRYAFDRFVVDMDTRSVELVGADVPVLQLTSAEFDLLGCFVHRRCRGAEAATKIFRLDPWPFRRAVRPHGRYADIAAPQEARCCKPRLQPDHDGAQWRISVHGCGQAGVVMLRITLATRLALITIVGFLVARASSAIHHRLAHFLEELLNAGRREGCQQLGWVRSILETVNCPARNMDEFQVEA